MPAILNCSAWAWIHRFPCVSEATSVLSVLLIRKTGRGFCKWAPQTGWSNCWSTGLEVIGRRPTLFKIWQSRLQLDTFHLALRHLCTRDDSQLFRLVANGFCKMISLWAVHVWSTCSVHVFGLHLAMHVHFQKQLFEFSHACLGIYSRKTERERERVRESVCVRERGGERERGEGEREREREREREGGREGEREREREGERERERGERGERGRVGGREREREGGGGGRERERKSIIVCAAPWPSAWRGNNWCFGKPTNKQLYAVRSSITYQGMTSFFFVGAEKGSWLMEVKLLGRKLYLPWVCTVTRA